MTLGEVIERLKQEPPDKPVAEGFGRPRSYRGDYSELAFEPERDTTVGVMLAHAQSALGQVFEGYKDGEYRMYEHTSCHVAEWGDWNGSEDDLTRRRLDEMLSQSEIERLRAQLAAVTAELRDARAGQLSGWPLGVQIVTQATADQLYAVAVNAGHGPVLVGGDTLRQALAPAVAGVQPAPQP